jgi:hypothetical protein
MCRPFGATTRWRSRWSSSRRVSNSRRSSSSRRPFHIACPASGRPQGDATPNMLGAASARGLRDAGSHGDT